MNGARGRAASSCTASFAITSIIPKFNHHRHDTVTPICDFALALIARQPRDNLRDVVDGFRFRFSIISTARWNPRDIGIDTVRMHETDAR